MAVLFIPSSYWGQNPAIHYAIGSTIYFTTWTHPVTAGVCTTRARCSTVCKRASVSQFVNAGVCTTRARCSTVCKRASVCQFVNAGACTTRARCSTVCKKARYRSSTSPPTCLRCSSLVSVCMRMLLCIFTGWPPHNCNVGTHVWSAAEHKHAPSCMYTPAHHKHACKHAQICPSSTVTC